jgi:hypothetical protein
MSIVRADAQVTPRNGFRLEVKLIVAQLVKKFTEFYGFRVFITVFTRAATGFYPEPDESIPRPPILFLSDRI